MKYFFAILVFSFSLLITQTVFAEDRGGHCQPPSCLGLRGPFNSCGGKWVCALNHERYDRKDLDPEYICLRKGGSPKTKCLNGKEVKATAEEIAAEKAELEADAAENEQEPN